MNWLLRVADPWPVAMLWGGSALALALGALFIAAVPSRLLQGTGGRRAEAPPADRGAGGRAAARLCRPKREFILKDLRLFFRDNTQWSQLILLAVLLVVYLFNIKSLPLHSGERFPARCSR